MKAGLKESITGEGIARECYTNSLAHLERIDLLMQVQFRPSRGNYQADRTFQVLHISEQEVDALLTKPTGLPRWASREALRPYTESANCGARGD